MKIKNIIIVESLFSLSGGIGALHFIRKENLHKEKRILIYGASGSVGTYVVQVAKYYGIEVTGVCSTANVEFVKLLGAERL